MRGMVVIRLTIVYDIMLYLLLNYVVFPTFELWAKDNPEKYRKYEFPMRYTLAGWLIAVGFVLTAITLWIGLGMVLK